MLLQHKYLWLFPILIALLLSACGFQLRQDANFPESLQRLTLALNSGSATFERDLRIALQQSNIQILEAASESSNTYQLKVNRLNSSDTVLARATDNDVTQVQRRISATYFIRNASGKAVYGPRTVSTSIMLNNQDAEQSLKSAYNEEQMRRVYQVLANELIYDLGYAPL